jgi:hypothetical protein
LPEGAVKDTRLIPAITIKMVILSFLNIQRRMFFKDRENDSRNNLGLLWTGELDTKRLRDGLLLLHLA